MWRPFFCAALGAHPVPAGGRAGRRAQNMITTDRLAGAQTSIDIYRLAGAQTYRPAGRLAGAQTGALESRGSMDRAAGTGLFLTI